MGPGRALSWALRDLLVIAAIFAIGACGDRPSVTPAAISVPPVTTHPTTTSTPSASPRASAASAAVPSPKSSPKTSLAIATLDWHLDTPLTRAVAFTDDGTIVVAGGLTASGTTGVVRQIDPATGRVRNIGSLVRSVHDAAGAVVGGRLVLFGGGSSIAGSAVQVVIPGATGSLLGNLPAARADLAAIVIADRVYLIGGGLSGAPDPRIWASTDGTDTHLVGRLRLGVRYAAVGSSGTSIYVFGGATSNGPRSEIQRFDTATGMTTIVGRLPVRLSDATAITLDGRIFVTGGSASTAVWSFDPPLATLTQVGRLPYRVSDAAGVVVDGRGYLIGGEDPHFLDTVISMDLQ